MHNDNSNDKLTFSPEEYAIRFAPETIPQTPRKHSTVWGYEIKPDQYGLIFADTMDAAADRLIEEFNAAEEDITLFQIDNDQDIIEFK